MNDKALVELALAEPQQGFAAIYDAYGDRLYDYCYGILRSAHDASDATQDTFLAALDKLPQLRDPTKLRPWLYAIARSHCFKRTRGRKRENVSDTIGETVIGDSDVASSIDTAHLPTLVWDAVAGLSEVDRAVIDLTVRHELEGEELAASLGVPSSKAYVMLHRAKARLETSVGALLVARAGTDDCAALDAIVGGGEFTPLIRKRVARHIESCEVCAETRDRNRPEALLALIPLLGAPEGLREQILTAIGAAGGPPDTGAGSQAGETTTRWTQTSSTDGRAHDAAGALDWDDAGFPNPIGASRVAGWIPTAAGVALAAAILLIAGFVLVDRDDTTVVEAAGPADTTATTVSPATAESTAENTTNKAPEAAVLGATQTTVTTAAVTTTNEADSSTALAPAPTDAPTETAPAPTEQPPTTSSPPPTTTETTTTEAATTTAAPTTTSTTTTTTTTDPPTTTSTSTTTTVAPDTTPPTVSALTVDCGDPVRLSLSITDDTTEKVTVDIVARWHQSSAPFTRLTGTTYVVDIPRDQLPDGVTRFTVVGTVEDPSGNVTNGSLRGSCTIIN